VSFWDSAPALTDCYAIVPSGSFRKSKLVAPWQLVMARAPEISDSELTPLYARYLARLIQPFPNFDLIFIRSLRQKAVQLLQLRHGDRVLDAGCGPGGSFAYLLDKVGTEGEVVGIEISPAMTTLANKRIQNNGWRNVHVLESPAERVNLEGFFDALLMLGAPDVYGSAASLDNLLPHLKSNSRIVAFGARLKPAGPARMLNPLFRTAFAKLTFASTPVLSYEPWALLNERVEDLRVQEMSFGWMFLASGIMGTNR
jgi:demethylmenaquinone methyltransferase/2-methoxy-6-polyprenyl-1,4-benzoquinol methylase